MNFERKYALQSKQLDKANQKIEELKNRINSNKDYYESKIELLQNEIVRLKEENSKIVPLMEEIENLRREWKIKNSDLDDKCAEYQILIYQLKLLKKKLFK